MKKIIRSEKEMRRFAASFAKTLKGGGTLALVGGLGAGKTTFVKGLAKALGIEEEITSPTFVYMHVHKTRDRRPEAGSRIQLFVHVDAYRGDAGTMREIGLEEYMGRPDTVTVIEWGDKVKDILPSDTVMLNFFHAGGDRRDVEILRPKACIQFKKSSLVFRI
jgi:tRNA threonylcarbamoyladenosine biosynthesis protein TsaE